MLSALGRREEALEAADEALRIRRQLAAQRPDAFLPDLAMSLGVKGTVLQKMEDLGGAAASFRDGIECLKPLFLRLPNAFRPMMAALARGYIQACRLGSVELDISLLKDLLPHPPGHNEEPPEA